MPQVHHPQSWFKMHPLAVWGGVGLLLLGGGVVVVTMSLGLVVGTKKPSSTPTARPAGIKINTPTAEEIRAAKDNVRADGTITSITSTALILTPTGQIKSVTFKLTDATKYLQGQSGAQSDRASLRLGQKAVVGYDSTTSAAATVWGGYDE